MEHYEDDEDTHYCIKCHVTLTGLDNYVRHRQTGCRPSEPKNEVMYPEILNADTFFNSLELRSSVKPKSSGIQVLDDRDKKSRADDKRKKGKRCQEIEEAASKEKLMTLSPVVTDLDDPTDHIGIPSLVGFPDIVTFTEKSTAVTPNKITPKLPDKKRSEDHRVWLNDAILEELDGNKEAVSPTNALDSEAEYDYRHEDESDVESDEDDSYSEYEEDGEYHSQAHTGGKWKPEQLLQEISPQNDDDLEQEDYRPDSPPSHTGGKWKPTEKADEDEQANIDEEDDDEDEDDDDEDEDKDRRQPPPGHTRGKWIPGVSVVTPAPSSDTSFWCTPCDRRLASKLLYNRHLRSDLHARRTIQEIEGDIKLPRTVGPLLRGKALSKRQQALALKSSDKKRALTNKQQRTRQREKLVLRCEMCQARVRRVQLGKHLLSHYHCRVAGLNPSSSIARRFILENMDNVVRQCPFQCSSCRFYCNTEETFLLHWRSELHNSVENDPNSSLTCVSCNFWCDSNEAMEEHLLGLEHREAVAMINGSVPVVIRRQRTLICDTCNRHFQYNFQLRIHSRETGHPPSATATDDYQQRIACRHCAQVFRSLVALQRHQLTSHTSKDGGELPAPYFCSFCSINFETARDAVLHRRTTSHKQTVKEHKFRGVETSQRDCGHCGERVRDLEALKLHLIQSHHNLCHRCSQCGSVFALSQDLARHTKKQECIKALDQKLSFKGQKWRCTNCSLFSTDSQSEFIFHQVLHAGVVEEDLDGPGTSKASVKYRCLLCDKILPKESMRNHIRRHTGERPFCCSKCNKSFSRRSSLNVHGKGCVARAQNQDQGVKVRERNYVCAECNEAFYTKHTLRQHMLRHAGKSYKCGVPGCPTVLRTANELKSHRRLIHETGPNDRKFSCNECSYAAKTRTQLRRHQEKHKTPLNQAHLTCPYKDCTFATQLSSHLKRHIRVHTGTKPYKCRHCPYASNNLENLRKHVLSTRRHPGKMIYECETCCRSGLTYTTNFSRELRAHLVEEHPETYPTVNHANDYVSSIFSAGEP
ncbi:zinc finger protein 99 [Diachasma alloeum]|uniref:zinc finger protein 99 n=1 Tax=Diachasma alloeum TaxID=454923 RepID=UPI0007382EBD|nr:zinc finger protein 99 [Diachasma alloeum]